MLLSDYITDLRFILDEFPTPGIYWSDSQLTLCINKARDRIAFNTRCCRAQATISAVQGQIPYPYSTLLTALQQQATPPPARAVIRALNINFQWSPSFQPVLRNYSWSVLNAYFLSNPSIQSITLAWGQYDLQSFYVWPPSPNSSYTMAVDALWLPQKLVNPTDPDNAIPEMVGEHLVPTAAARWALYYRRDYTASAEMQRQYDIERAELFEALPPWQIASMYDEEF